MARPRKTLLDRVAEDTGLALELPSETPTEQVPLDEGGSVPDSPQPNTEMGEEVIVPQETVESWSKEPVAEPEVKHDLTERAVLEMDDYSITVELKDDVPTVTRVEPIKTIEELASERNPSGVVTDMMDADAKESVLDERLKAVLCKQKPRGAVPTLVRYHMNGQVPWRSVIIDIPEADLKEGWDIYRTVMPADGERYLLKVYELTRMDIPRLFRTVVELRLE
jgi:hypothetical protein